MSSSASSSGERADRPASPVAAHSLPPPRSEPVDTRNWGPEKTVSEALGYATVIHFMDQGYCRLEVLDPVEGQLLDARFLEVNPAFEIHTGWSDVQGRLISEVAPAREPFWSQAFEQVLADGQMLTASVLIGDAGRGYETCIIRMGGPGSRHLVLLLRDITGLLQANQRLRQSEKQARETAEIARTANRRLTAVIEATPAAVVMVDPQYRVVLMNSQARELRGNSPEEGPMEALAHWADGSERHGQPLKSSEWPLSRALQGEPSREVIEIDEPSQGRSCGVFLTSAAPILGPDAKIEGAVVISTNITDRIKVEQELQRASDRKDEFLAMLAHELRNPLSPIVAAAQWLVRSDVSVDQIREGCEIIARQAQHMRGLIDDLLDVSRVSRGLIRIERRPLDLHDLVREALEQSQPLLKSMDHAVRLKPSPQSLPLRGDAKRIVQILTNLLNNAAKYTPAGGWVRVSTRRLPDWVEVEVTDNGIGMTAQTLSSAFDLFSQAHAGIDRREGGLGIGLALVKKLVQLHGGQVYAASAGLGCGSTFTVRLPLDSRTEGKDTSDGPNASGPAQPAEGAQKTKSLRILVVDDNVDAAKTLAILLRVLGHTCEIAHDAQQALAMAEQGCPDVFILDIGLPGMDGRELARHLRQDPKTCRARIVALSGYAQPQDRKAGLLAGFDHYLVKPVDVDRLLQVL